jgi:hypothetical protein
MPWLAPKYGTKVFRVRRRNQMTIGALRGMRVAILATDGFEQAELLEPRIALEHAGAVTLLRSSSPPLKTRSSGSSRAPKQLAVSALETRLLVARRNPVSRRLQREWTREPRCLQNSYVRARTTTRVMSSCCSPLLNSWTAPTIASRRDATGS